MTKIAIASDHAGYELKKSLITYLNSLSYKVEDFGTYNSESCDYPDYAARVAKEISDGNFEKGILICGSGIGVSITANKFRGVRAALVCDVERARLARLHNDANILCLGARFTDEQSAKEIVKIFLETDFEGGRHSIRVNKISSIEQDIKK